MAKILDIGLAVVIWATSNIAWLLGICQSPGVCQMNQQKSKYYRRYLSNTGLTPASPRLPLWQEPVILSQMTWTVVLMGGICSHWEGIMMTITTANLRAERTLRGISRK